MKSISRAVSIVIGMCIVPAFAGDQRDEHQAELAAIKVELNPLRQKAYAEPDVIEARKKLDAAYKAYWDAVRIAILRLDPSKTALIEKDVELRKELSPIVGEKPAVTGDAKDAAR